MFWRKRSGRVDLVGELDEVGGLLGVLVEDHAVVGDDPDRPAVQLGPAGDDLGPVGGLELVEARAVDDPRDHLAGVEGDLEVVGGDAEQLLRIVDGIEPGTARLRPALAPVQVAHDLAPDPRGVDLVGGDEVVDAGDPRVHLGAAERLLLRVLAGRHLHQRRSAEEDQPLLADHHRVVGHAGLVGAARGRVAGDDRDGRDSRRRLARQVAEVGAAGNEDLLLPGQVGAT